jgi:heat shock protein HspQ
MIRKKARPPGEGSSRFAPGDLVRHRRYGYRGVVVDLDRRCAASEEWYASNQTQPDRDQPWYHVLVDRSVQMTYAAEENLLPDESAAPVVHPLVERYFSEFLGAFYVRNDRPFDPTA